jgi:DNA-binding response OmpR family regulator
MTAVMVVGADGSDAQRLTQALGQVSITVRLAANHADALEALEEALPDALVVNVGQPVLSAGEVRDLLRMCAEHGGIPALALVSEDRLASHDFSLGFTDFLLSRPVSGVEAAARVKQALWRTGRAPAQEDGMLHCGDLVIDTNRYEVYLANTPVELTFKEYELLRFLAMNQDKVFTREVLLNRVWGYDYFGGARTVDVHIRRLRSKIEEHGHVFIDTVRNVGYRFRPSGMGQASGSSSPPR